MQIANESWAPVSRGKCFSCFPKGTFLSLSRQEGREKRQRWLERLAPGTQGAPKGSHSVRTHDRKDTRKRGSESMSGRCGNRRPGRRGSSGRGSWACCCCCQVASVVSDSVRPHRRQPTRVPRPWDSLGKNTGVGCHFLLQCIK